MSSEVYYRVCRNQNDSADIISLSLKISPITPAGGIRPDWFCKIFRLIGDSPTRNGNKCFYTEIRSEGIGAITSAHYHDVNEMKRRRAQGE